ncbi:MAG: hypothetical protein R6V62_02095 [Candidatus Fermentibacteraceae bacterium]
MAMSDSAVKLLRGVSLCLGVLMIAVAFLSDMAGLSAEGGMSRNQIGFLLAGLALVSAGLLGRKFPVCYRGVALVVLNVIVFLVLLEVVSLVLLKTLNPESMRIHSRKVSEGHLEQLESNVVQGVYAPFVVWRSNPLMNCDSVTITDDNFRLVPGSSDDPGAYRVFLFGGSAMWGVGVSDSNTIACFLQADMNCMMPRPVAVSNFAQVAHSSSQELVELVLQLRAGNVPDCVVFFDGFNDVWGAYESGAAGGHHSQKVIAARVEGRPEAYAPVSPLRAILMNTNSFILLSSLRGRINETTLRVENLTTYRTMGIDPDSLACDIVETYFGNCEVVRSLAESYGFRCLFVWQPTVWYGDKCLTDFERSIVHGGEEFFIAGADPAFRELLCAAYALYENSMTDSLPFTSLAGIFDEEGDEVYIDHSGAHVNPAANRAIAGRLLEKLSL